MMTLESLEAQVLALPKETQVLFLSRLLEHLSHTEKIDQDIADEWVKEAILRDQELETAQINGIAADEVFQTLRNSLS